jgi:hypothetical protein
MRKIIVVGSLVGLATARAIARELEQLQGVEVVTVTEAHAYEIKPRPPVIDAPLGPPAYYGFGRKGKGEKKRAASARFRKGWK